MKREYSLDVLRIFATIGIVFHHFQQVTGTFFEGGLNFHGGKFTFGMLVEFFFILSGYLAYRYAKEEAYQSSLKEFLLPKMKRLLPIVFISSVAYEVFLHLYIRICERPWIFDKNLTVWGTITNGLGLQTGWVFENQRVNNPTWYVSVLLLCYLLYYFFGYLERTKKCRAEYFYAGMILLGMGIWEYEIELPFINLYAARGYYAFFFGLLLAKFLESRKITAKDALRSFIVILVLTFGLVNYYHYFDYGVAYIMTYLYYPALIILFLWEPIRKLLTCGLLGVIGKITYQVYVWQIPMLLVMYILVKMLVIPVRVESFGGMLLFTIWMFVWGTISYYLIDEPIQKRLNRK